MTGNIEGKTDREIAQWFGVGADIIRIIRDGGAKTYEDVQDAIEAIRRKL